MASVTVLAAASYFPEYIRARLSAGLMFHMMNRTPKIDNLSEAGLRQVHTFFSFLTFMICPYSKYHA